MIPQQYLITQRIPKPAIASQHIPRPAMVIQHAPTTHSFPENRETKLDRQRNETVHAMSQPRGMNALNMNGQEGEAGSSLDC